MDDLDPAHVLDLSVVDALRGLDEGGEDDLFAELVALFVEDARRLVGELETALADGDARKLERCAHTLKSSSASLGAMRLSAMCFELEKRGRSETLDGTAELVRETSESCRQACRALESLKA